MGSDAPFRQTPRKDQAIVAFDFDGTLTIRDSFTEFLRWRAGAGGWALGLVKLAPAVAAYARGRDRGRIKAASVREFLRGVEKVRRLRAVYGEDVRLAAAYGDTSGDTEMLAIADEAGFRTFTARPRSSRPAAYSASG